MRSRFSAYALRLPYYIIQTTHPENPAFEHDIIIWTRELLKFMDMTVFFALEVLEVSSGNKLGFVTFYAKLEQDSKDASFTERSRFLRVGDRWLYRDGQFLPGRERRVEP